MKKQTKEKSTPAILPTAPVQETKEEKTSKSNDGGYIWIV